MKIAGVDTLLTSDDPAPFAHLPWERGPPVVWLCDHAGSTIPGRLNGLGIDPAELERHIAIDIGAAALTRALRARIGGAAVLAVYSRLVIDPNREPDHPTLVPRASDGVVIPANQNLDDAAIALRRVEIHEAYHGAVAAACAAVEAGAGVPARVVSIHSFEPAMSGLARPWHVGVLWNRDGRLALPLLEALRRLPDVVVGDNEPYSGRDLYYTNNRHGGDAGRLHVSIEMRNDLIRDAAGVEHWAARLEQALGKLLEGQAATSEGPT